MRDRDLVRLYWPVEIRPAFDALLAIDDVMAEIIASSTQPALGAIRLAWWREALERLDSNPPPPEPRLAAGAAQLLPLGVTGAALAAIEDGYAAMLEEEPPADRLGASGEALFAVGSTLLGAADPKLGLAGRLYGASVAMRRGAAASPEGIDLAPLAGHRFARALRPLTALARLAARDIAAAPRMEAEATPARAAALLRHRFSGRIC